MTDQQSQFNGFAIVEVFGHQKYAGYVTTEAFGQAVLFRVDVPPLPERERVTKFAGWIGETYAPPGTTVKEQAVQGYTKYFGPGAIYALTPCSEDVAKAAVEEMQPRQHAIVKMPEGAQAALPPRKYGDGFDDDDEDVNDAGDPAEIL